MARNKVIIEFDKQEDFDDIIFALHISTVRNIIDKLREYRKHLDKYEERKSIPTEEIEQKLGIILREYYDIADLL